MFGPHGIMVRSLGFSQSTMRGHCSRGETDLIYVLGRVFWLLSGGLTTEERKKNQRAQVQDRYPKS